MFRLAPTSHQQSIMVIMNSGHQLKHLTILFGNKKVIYFQKCSFCYVNFYIFFFRCRQLLIDKDSSSTVKQWVIFTSKKTHFIIKRQHTNINKNKQNSNRSSNFKPNVIEILHYVSFFYKKHVCFCLFLLMNTVNSAIS